MAFIEPEKYTDRRNSEEKVFNLQNKVKEQSKR